VPRLLAPTAGWLDQRHVLEHRQLVRAEQPAQERQQPFVVRERVQPFLVVDVVHELAYGVHPLLEIERGQPVRRPGLELNAPAARLDEQRLEPVEGGTYLLGREDGRHREIAVLAIAPELRLAHILQRRDDRCHEAIAVQRFRVLTAVLRVESQLGLSHSINDDTA
jgi:hypothetical protein